MPAAMFARNQPPEYEFVGQYYEHCRREKPGNSDHDRRNTRPRHEQDYLCHVKRRVLDEHPYGLTQTGQDRVLNVEYGPSATATMSQAAGSRIANQARREVEATARLQEQDANQSRGETLTP